MRLTLTIALSLMLLICGCPGPQPPPQATNPTPSPTLAPTVARPSPTAKVEYPPPQVEFVSVVITGTELVATIRNSGSTDAHLTGCCEFKCPVIPESAHASAFINGDILGAGKEQAFSTARAGTCALPLISSCRVEVRSWVNGEKGSQTKTVSWSGQLSAQ